MSGGATIITVLDMFGARLAGELAFSLSGQGSVAARHPLAGEIGAALDGMAASLPYPRGKDVMWVTLAPGAEDLRRVIEDLRCWVLPSFGWEAVPSIVSERGSAGPMAAMLLAHSPQGYFRWHSRLAETDNVIARLGRMRGVIAQAPVREAQLRPTLGMLRRQFTLGLATRDRDMALKAVDEVDQRQLDTASNSLSMRIRLAAAFGNDQAIVDHPQLDDLLSTRAPQRVVESVLLAHHAVFLADHEAAGDIEAALAAYLPLRDRLSGLADEPSEGADTAIVRMAAYDAAVAGGAHRLHALAIRFPGDAVIGALAASYPETEQSATRQPATLQGESPVIQGINRRDIADETDREEQTPVTAEPAFPLNWAQVPSLVATSAHEPLAAFLQHTALMPDTCDPGDGDFIIELFTDSDISADTKKRAEAEEVLTTVIDAYICEERFPRRERLILYQVVLDIWASNRARSTDPIDGQLLLTIAEALLRLDDRLEASVAASIAGWWEARPVRSRLAWLGEAIELLTEQSIAQSYLALWYAGAAHIKIDREGLALADRHLWHRLGRRLGLDAAATDEALGRGWQSLENSGDPLLAFGSKKIAIVSLHERAAREAAAQIVDRTNANVVVVTDHAAGEGTASAATADVILFVWGATKHSVYRAFDKVRDRLEYVQGTGSASIVRALERRAASAAK
jgi:hypothetical protein